MNKNLIYLLRVIHTSFAILFLSCIGYIYYSALAKQYDSLLYIAIAALLVEGLVVFINGGDCPLAFFHRRLGDKRGFFDLFLPARMARHAIPFFVAVTILGLLLLVVSSLPISIVSVGGYPG